MQMLTVKARTSNKAISPTSCWLRTVTMASNSQNLIKVRLAVFDNYANEYLRKLDKGQTVLRSLRKLSGDA